MRYFIHEHDKWVELTRWQYESLRNVGDPHGVKLCAVERLEGRTLFSCPSNDLPWITLPDGWLYVTGDMKCVATDARPASAEG